MIKLDILTDNENKVLNKKLNYKSLSQVESNYLSRAIRPKLQMLEKSKEKVGSILRRISYNQKGLAIENKIKLLALKLVKSTEAIIVYGSAIQTNYTSYGDIDILIITRGKSWNNEKEKYKLIKEIKEEACKCDLNLDIQLLEKRDFYSGYSASPDLIYQLKDHKLIYGKLSIPEEINLSKLNLNMKLDWSNIENITPTGKEIYRAIRNAFLVGLLANKIVDNEKLKEALSEQLGNYLLEKLKNNMESNLERKFALAYLKELSQKIRQEIKEAKWEKIEL